MDSIERQDDARDKDGDITEVSPEEILSEQSVAKDTDAKQTSKTEGDGSDTDGMAQDTDYDKIAREDLIALKEQFPEVGEITSITELDNPLRYAALRDLGLTPREAYLATQRRKDLYDNRNHLRGSVPRSAGGLGGSMSQSELSAARELFSGLSDRELQRLYKTVTK